MPTLNSPALRDIAIVATYELGEALRSRRVLILVIMFVGGATFGSLAFIQALHALETSVAQAMAVAGPEKSGAMAVQLMRSPEFERMLGGLLDDDALAKELVGLPPLALFYGWLGLTFMPALIMLSSADAVSAELANGSARFSLLRTGRLPYSIGKLVGQTLLMLVGLSAGAIAVWLTGFASLASFDAPATAFWLSLLSVRVGFYAFAHVGLAVGLSHFTRSVPLSRVLALASLMVFSVLAGVGTYSQFVRTHLGALADALLMLLPSSHRLGLWQPSLVDRLPSLVMLCALGIGYFAVGYSFRARRDA
jgi:ABC-type transport system involved in multi-copper enzyme maturation permease subunit